MKEIKVSLLWTGEVFVEIFHHAMEHIDELHFPDLFAAVDWLKEQGGSWDGEKAGESGKGHQYHVLVVK